VQNNDVVLCAGMDGNSDLGVAGCQMLMSWLQEGEYALFVLNVGVANDPLYVL
jgi:hypothetical protein